MGRSSGEKKSRRSWVRSKSVLVRRFDERAVRGVSQDRFDELTLCDVPDCDGSCGLWHRW